ncbi:serine hydrolase [Humibacillus sp. DSM 29435]|uniref:serine hydrolase domain-containing protein n=1 Tax=Humibacillus sp. DSM 29435 TaxID=1869167 RepID=UPI001586257E|nr:serine hydrolase domain-containing protein [Humibacillus sp. DSM 29435]
MLSITLSWVGVAVLVVLVLGYASSISRRSPSAVGDPALAAELGRLCSRRTRRLAASVVDLGDHPSTRSAFVRCDAATRFEIGSVTKALTGLLLADALERGEVTLQTQVGEVIAKAHGTPLGGVTLLELCTHTSGLPRLALRPMTLLRVPLHGLLGLDPYRGTSPTSLLSAAARQHLRRRGHYRYSNLGAAVLGQVVATVAGRDFSEVLRERLLDPLSLGGAGVSTPDQHADWGWSPLGVPFMPWVMGGYAPAGGVFATLDDLTALAQGLLDESSPGQSALAPLHDIGAGRQIGLFWMTDTVAGTGRQMVWHNGATGGYSAFFALFPQARRAVVVVANTSGRKETERVATALARWLARSRQDL